MDWIDEGIKLIRSSEKIGVNTCSSFSECYSDEEIREEINDWIESGMWEGNHSPEAILKWAEETEALRFEQFEETQAGIEFWSNYVPPTN